MCAVWVGVYNAVQLGGAWFIMLFNWEGVVAPVFYLKEEAEPTNNNVDWI